MEGKKEFVSFAPMKNDDSLPGKYLIVDR